MSAIEEHLMTGERIVHRASLHPVALIRPAALCAASLLLLAARLLSPSIAWLAWLSPLPLAFALPEYLEYRCSEYVVTDRRLVIKTGWLTTETLESLLNKLGTISVSQSIPGRLLGYGTVMVKGPGGAQEILDELRDPVRFSREIQEQMVRLDQKPAAPPAPPLYTDEARQALELQSFLYSA